MKKNAVILLCFLSFCCFGQENLTDSCFQKLADVDEYLSYKNYKIQYNYCEKINYICDTTTNVGTQITIPYGERKAAFRFNRGFVYKGGDVKFLSTINDKALIAKAHLINFNDKDSIISAYICGKGWLFMDYKGDTISFGNCSHHNNYIPDLHRNINIAKIDKYNGKDVQTIYGYLDSKGKWLIKPQYSNAEEFNDGFAKVKFKGKWKLINEKGEFVIKPTYKTEDLGIEPKK